MSSSKTPYKKLGTVLNVALIGILLIGFFYYADTDELIRVLSGTSAGLFILAVATGILVTFLISVRLWVVLRKQGIEFPLLVLIGINVGIRFYSFFSPISSIASIMRWSRLVPKGKSAEGLAALGVNRVFDIVIAISVGVFWGASAINQDILDPSILITYLIFLVLVLWTFFAASRSLSIWAGQRKAVVSSAPAAWAYRALEKFSGSFSVYRTFSTSEILILLGSALLADLVGLIGYLIIALSLNIPISFVDLGWIRALGLLAAWTPFTLPGGFGMREISTVVLLTSLGIGAEQATAFSLLVYARSVIIALIGGVIELVFYISKLTHRSV